MSRQEKDAVMNEVHLAEQFRHQHVVVSFGHDIAVIHHSQEEKNNNISFFDRIDIFIRTLNCLKEIYDNF